MSCKSGVLFFIMADNLGIVHMYVISTMVALNRIHGVFKFRIVVVPKSRLHDRSEVRVAMTLVKMFSS